jgi:hypothetical protein
MVTFPRLRTLAALVAGAVGLSAQAGGPSVRISEVMFDPYAVDRGQEFIEISGAAGESLQDLWILVIDGDESLVRGRIDNAIPLRSISVPITWYSLGSNGLLLLRDGVGTIDSSAEDGANGAEAGTLTVIRQSTSTASGFGNGATGLENGSFTMLLVRGYDGTTARIDTNGDGVQDVTPWTEVVDGFAYIEGSGFGYAPAGLPVFRATTMGFRAGGFVRAFDGNMHAVVPVGVNPTPITNVPLIGASGPYFLPPARIWPAVAGAQYFLTPGRPNPATPNSDSLCGNLLTDVTAGPTDLATNWGLPNVDPRTGGCDWGDPTVGAIGAARLARFTPAVSGPHAVSLCGSGISDTLLAVMSGCGTGTALACNDDGASCSTLGQSELTVDLTAGVPVYVAAGSFMFADDAFPGSAGTLRLTITPPDDGCNSVGTLASGGGTVQASVDASVGDLELPAGTFATGSQRLHHARYFHFTPALGGMHLISTCGTGGTLAASRIAVLDGCGAGSVLVAASDGGCGGPGHARLFASLVAGHAYTVAVGGDSAADTGTVTLVVARDADSDGTADGSDGCPNDPLKTAPGACGCGVPETDSDADGAADCVDACPNDPLKVSAGSCGCGNPETDNDGDGVPNCVDNCPQLANPGQADCDMNGIGDACQGAADCDANGVPDACQLALPANDLNFDGVLDACQHPRVLVTAGTAFAPGQDVVVTVSFAEILGRVVGGQMGLLYDSSLLTYTSAEIGGAPFGTIIYEQHLPAWSATRGRVRLAIGLPLDGSTPPGVSTGTLARLHFTAKGTSCSPASVLFPEGGTNWRLTSSGGQSLGFALQNTVAVIVDGVPPVLSGVPAAVSPVPADAGRTDGALQPTISGAAVTASDACAGSPPVTVSVSLPGGGTSSSIPARFAIGTTTVTWSAVDDAGNVASASRQVVVEPYQVVRVTPSLNGAMLGSGPRTIGFAVDGQAPETRTVNFTLAQGDPVDLQVPVAATAPCLTACDTLRTLATRMSPTVQGTIYEASGTLVGGDSNGDNAIDILDFGLFVGDVGVALRDARSNFNADLLVSNADFTFITLAFLRMGESCAPAVDGRTPLERVTIKQLRRMGLGDLAAADLNRDGALDQADIAWALQHGFGGPQGTPVDDLGQSNSSPRNVDAR